MKSVLKKSLGFQIPVAHFESYDEYDKAAGKVGAALDEAQTHLWLHDTATEVRSWLADAVEAVTGIKRLAQPIMVDGKEKDADGKVVKVPLMSSDGKTPQTEYTQKDGEYIEWALAKANKTPEVLQATVDAWFAKQTVDVDGKPVPLTFALDPKTAERKTPQPKKLPAKFLEIATGLVANPTKLAKWGKDYASVMGTALTDTQKATPEAVGWAIKAFFEAKERIGLESIKA